MPFRFVHAADIHLDSPLRSLALRDPALAELVGDASRRALVAIVELCLHERVDALLLAGDLYDGDQTSMKTARFLADQLGRLHGAGIRVFIIRGNHDHLSRITRELQYPDLVHRFDGRAGVQRIDADGLAVAIHGLSFAQAEAPDSLLPKYQAPVADAVNIGLMHTSLDGSPGHDNYAPCRLTDLQGHGFDYWALGHIHRRAVTQGAGAVVMPGIPQGRDINEAGTKSVTLVTIADDRRMTIEERPTSLAEFARVTVPIAGLADRRAVLAAMEAALAGARAAAGSQHLIVRLRLEGATELAWGLRADADLVRAEAEQRGAAIGSCWIEGLELDCRAPLDEATADPVAELRRLIGRDVIDDPGFRAEMAAVATELRAALPPDCRHVLGDSEAAFADNVAALTRDGVEDVLARLQPRGEA